MAAVQPESADDRSRLCRAIAAYQSAYPGPFVLHPGDELVIGERESEWSGWLWCTDRWGESRWVPEAYVQRRGDTGVALCDYDAAELSVDAGEELFVNRQESGWMWCTNRQGQSGWVPVKNLDCESDENKM
jgi:hypothetical protein